MPTILVIFGLKVIIYFNDHTPAHVHVLGNGNEAIFNLSLVSNELELRENNGFSNRELKKINDALLEKIDFIREKWSEIHGTNK
jgi:hypothetical protein